jgi:predicted AlkP superfamily pyrophosphatase or phosphodiesterase
MKKFKHWLIWFSVVVLLITQANAEKKPSLAPRDRVLILISIDALRADYLQKFNPPNLVKLAAEGVHAEKLISMFPTLTFPNHQTIVTGLRPEHHGIINNNMYDPVFKENFAYNRVNLHDSRWWGGEPIWATAIKQGLRADCMFWPGTGVAMAGLLPTEYTPYDGTVEPNGCVDPVLAWLDQPADKRPHLIITYFHHVDSVSHREGTESPEIGKTVQEVDAAIGRLVEGIHQRKLDDVVNIVIVSDHGMTDISPQRVIELRDFVDMDSVQVDCSGAVGGLRPLDGDVNALYKKFAGKESHFHVYRRENMPKRYHYTDNRRIPPVILVADEGWYIGRRAAGAPPVKNMNKATHGFDPDLTSMGATFIAYGPAFRHGVTLKPFENVHIYNLLCATLGLKPAPNDGDDRLVKSVLAR